MVLIFILVVNCNQPEPFIILFLLTTVGSSIERYLYIGIQHLPFQILQDILQVLTLHINAPAPITSIGFNDERISVAFQSGHKVSTIFLDTGEHLILVESEIDKQNTVFYPGSYLKSLQLIGVFGEQCQAFRTASYGASQDRNLDACCHFARSRCRPDLGQLIVQPNDGAILDQYVFEG